MLSIQRELTKEQVQAYKEGKKSAYDLVDEVTSVAEKIGYGVYGGRVTEEDGKHFVEFSKGSSCD